MTAIRVRRQELLDAEAIAAIYACPAVVAGTLQLPFPSVEATRERLSQRALTDHALVAEADGIVVGNLGLRLDPAPRRRHCGSIGIAVRDDFHGRGIGSALLTAALDLADNWLGLHRLELSVYVDNAAAIHLYEKFGFVVEGTARDYAFRNGAFVDALTMARVRR